MKIPLTVGMMYAAMIIGGILVVAFMVYAFVGIVKRKGQGESKWKTLFRDLLSTASVGLAVLCFAVFLRLEVKGYPRWDRDIIGLVLVAMIGAGLFLLKLKRLLIYALLEIMFAIGVTLYTLDNLPDVTEPARLIGMVGSVYFLIRGLDNGKKALDERRAVNRAGSLSLRTGS